MKEFPIQHQSYQSSQSSDSDSEANQQILNAQIQKIQQQLKNVPYELILRQRQAEKQSLMPKNSKGGVTHKIKKIAKKKQISQTVKHDKNEAVEVSIHQRNRKKQVEIFAPEKKKAIDPRFQSFAGHYNQDLAMKSFNFIPKLQQAEITELKGRLKGNSRGNKLNSHQREVLTTEYNRVTSDYKRVELSQLQKQTKKEIKQNHGNDYHIKKKYFRQEFQKRKLEGMSQTERQKKLKEKDAKIRRAQFGQRRKALNMHSQRQRKY